MTWEEMVSQITGTPNMVQRMRLTEVLLPNYFEGRQEDEGVLCRLIAAERGPYDRLSYTLGVREMVQRGPNFMAVWAAMEKFEGSKRPLAHALHHGQAA